MVEDVIRTNISYVRLFYDTGDWHNDRDIVDLTKPSSCPNSGGEGSIE
ncbi:MAG: hypothetical protein ACRD8Z_21255 [Nitrososphaeraceae archaeon]